MEKAFLFTRVWHRSAWARWQRILQLGIKSLWLNKLRSILTVLGIVFGVCSVIAMLAIGEGASFEAQEQIKNLGSQNIILRSVKPPEEQKVSDRGNQSFVLEYGITYADMDRIQSTVPGIMVVVPGRILREYAWNISRRVDCEIVATVPWYPQMRNRKLAQGRFFTDQEMSERSNVCVISQAMVPVLFPFDDPLGRTVRVASDYYRVVGVLEPQSKGPPAQSGGESVKANAPRMFIPLETAKTRYGEILRKVRSGSFEQERVELHEVTIKVGNPDRVRAVADAVNTLMVHNHSKKDYEMVVPLELLRRAERTKQIFNIVLGSIAAISLVVGGIGIMNIMLASVSERTREIGVRRALGAKRGDIVSQFLVETVMLSASGGIVGVLLGVAIPALVSYFAEMKTIIALWSPVLAFSISALVGVVFGLYPAFRAAQMDPVEALRHE
ncbi:MAG: ABC transporter permease [Verrucomicrobia bacterium]|nr:ABC transporter permease [Verrucomicrobiota bacterium]